MTVWCIPVIYSVIHFSSGFIGYFYPIVLALGVGWHIMQYALNIRMYIFQLTYKRGTSLEHTAVKLLEVLGGFLLAFVLMTFTRLK